MVVSFINCLILFTTSYVAYKFYLVKTKKTVVKNKSKKNEDYSDKISNYKRVEIERDRYSKKKIPENIHTIVVGSGIGGLSTAAFLSKAGKKVLVLEQHYIAGGCTHTFEENGVEHETGVHYIGNIEKRKQVLDLITENPIEWCKMGREDPDKYVYDEIVVGNNKYDLRSGKKNFIEDMCHWFPEEKDAIEIYVNLIEKVAKMDLFFMLKIVKNHYLHQILIKLFSFFQHKYYYYVNTSAYEVISMLTNNKELIAVLCGQFGNYGPTPKNASFFVHANIVHHYFEGGYYPRGGPSVIAKNIIPTIEKSGGRVLVGKKVKRVIVVFHNGCDRAVGVEMENGDRIYSLNVVSSIGVRNTYNQEYGVLKDPKWSDNYQNILSNIKQSVCHMYLFVNLKGTPTQLNLRSSNIWCWPEQDYDAMLEKYYDDPLNAPMPFFIGFSSAKDDIWEKNFPDSSNAIILTMATYEMFQKWKDDRCTSRSNDYKQLKQQFAEKMLEEGLFRFYPNLRDKVESYSLATPLTTKYYINSSKGESYGLESNSYRYSEAFKLRPKTNLSNFYLTGQDICTLGFTGALTGGILTAHTILGYGSFIDLITSRNLINDLLNEEN